ncbi:MAG TPA: hypothetical protein VJN89_09055 [Candidatus Acidoferrum sp.]|nr:hypothetical protein [Candidatus Acidoferrum sp.]
MGAKVFCRLPFELADGRRLERHVTTVLLTINGRKAPVPVAFGEAGEEAVLGATVLGSLGFFWLTLSLEKLVPRNLRMLPVGTNGLSDAYADREKNRTATGVPWPKWAEEVTTWSF